MAARELARNISVVGGVVFLRDRIVMQGDSLQLQLDDHVWVTVRVDGARHQLVVSIPLAGGLAAVATLPQGAQLRWPVVMFKHRDDRGVPVPALHTGNTPSWRAGAAARTDQVSMVRGAADDLEEARR